MCNLTGRNCLDVSDFLIATEQFEIAMEFETQES